MVLPSQLDKFYSKPSFQERPTFAENSSPAASNGGVQRNKNLKLNQGLPGGFANQVAGEPLKGKRDINHRLQDATIPDQSSHKLSANKTITRNDPSANARRFEGESRRFWPIQRVWQITPQLTETIKIGSVSPMERWELESIKEESWNCIGEVFLDHPVDWTQEPEHHEDDDADDESMTGSGA